MDLIDKLIGFAQKLGGLSAATIFALISIVQGYIIYRKERFTEDSNEKWRLTRDGQIRAEEAQTTVVSKLVDVTAMNTNAINTQTARIDRLSTLIEERLPRHA